MDQPNSSTSSFKKFLLKILIPFVMVLILVGYVFNYFFVSKIILGTEISGAYKVNRALNITDSNEIPFFGSSRAEETFIPDSLVKNGFNYGIVGTQDNVILFFLKEECKKNKSTPIVINFDLDGFDYCLGDPANYIYNSDNNAVRELLDSTYKTIYALPLLKFYGKFETLTRYYMNNNVNLTKFTNKGGSIEKNDITRNKFDELVNKRINTKWEFNNDKILLSGFLNLIHSNKKRKFVFVVAPYHESCFKSMKNYSEAENFLTYLRTIDNVLVFDFSKTIFPDSFFFDTSHLNIKGAVAFNKLLKDSLNKNGIE